MAMTKVSQFIRKYPSVDGYTLICVLQEISRRTQASPDTLLSVALVDKNAADYLIGVVSRLQDVEANDTDWNRNWYDTSAELH